MQIFENKGAMMGALQPAPARPDLGHRARAQRAGARSGAQRAYHARARQLPAAATTWTLELRRRRAHRGRERRTSSALVPFWAVWPFETLVLPRAPRRPRCPTSRPTERDALADLLRRLTRRYDNLFERAVPVLDGLAPARPTDGDAHPDWHLHAHFYPPLLRSATVRKFMVGYELLGRAPARPHARGGGRAPARAARCTTATPRLTWTR